MKYKVAALLCFFATTASAQEWETGEYRGTYDTVPTVSLKSSDGENEVYIFRKSKKESAIDRNDKASVYIGFKTNSLDQINVRSALLFKASKGRPLSLKSSSRIGGFDNNISMKSFHGVAQENCGIIGNILNSDKLTVRYFSTGDLVKDIVFDLPSNNEKVYSLLGFTKGKDCVEIFE